MDSVYAGVQLREPERRLCGSLPLVLGLRGIGLVLLGGLVLNNLSLNATARAKVLSIGFWAPNGSHGFAQVEFAQTESPTSSTR
jgi:hypothetical protein